MTRDYRKGAPRPRKRQERRGTCAFWFLFGGVLGAFGVGLVWLRYEPPAPLEQVVQGAPALPERQTPPKPKFDFYSLLPAEEVVVPAETPVEPVPLPPPGAARPAADAAEKIADLPAPSGSGDYVIQVGSFKRPEDAEELKAKLALLGVQARIQTVTAENGTKYHRVRTGTYDKAAASSLQAQLKQNGHESMMMKAR